jgi:3-oxoacyl-[acyl-carrier-protein] synthase II
VLILESEERAVARSARIYSEVLGYGLSNDAHHMTAPSAVGAGAVLAIRRCLEDAGLQPGDVRYVNAHGTGTSLNDPVEVSALWKVFGDEMDSIPVSSLKSQIGHGLSSGGAIEAIATALALFHQFLPPTAHVVESLDPRVDFVQPEARPAKFDTAMSNSFAFGGHAASLALSRWDA